MSSSNKRGGVRPGAGRPRFGSERLDATLSLCVTNDLYKRCKQAGNQAIRQILENHVPTTAANQATVRKSAWDDLHASRLANDDRTIARWETRAACGFPSPALDYAHDGLNLNDYLLRHPLSSFIVQTKGDSMIDAGIFEGDLVIVDRAVEPRSGSLVLAFVDGDFTIKELRFADGKPELHPKNASGQYPVIRPTDLEHFSIEGVLVGVVRKL